ncbi:CaiB/BaiF CoA transferase family protein [Sphingobium sp.]|uniref:CaiB/BaiF CoA transferase family protein n=1 Tax=Sphingobium sp. TaxID=1912891 RepID=UPI003B3A58D7
MKDQRSGKGVLDGLKVADFTMMMAGPLATRYLADMGADVVKIESPDGDYIRTRHPKRGESSTYFGQINAGKRSIALDLADPADLEVAKAIIAQSDILAENFRPGVMARFGLDYESVRAINPRIIYCSVSGYGVTGPGAKRPAFAQIVQAASGYDQAFMGYQDKADRPPNSMLFVADAMGASFAFSGILAALYHRDRSGEGQYVDVTLLESMLQLMVYEIQEAQFPATEIRPLFRPLKTSDGYVMITPTSQRNFEHAARAMGHPEWISDDRFAATGNRHKNWSTLYELMEAWTIKRPSSDCETELNHGGVPCSRYKSVKEALDDPQLEALGSMARVIDDEGAFLIPNLPFRMSASRVHAQNFVSGLDADRDIILAEVAQHDRQRA